MRHFSPGCRFIHSLLNSILSERCIYMHILRARVQLLNKRADQRLDYPHAAFPEKLRGLLGSGPGPGGREALCRHCAGRPSAHVVRLLGHLLCGAPLSSAQQPGLSSWAAGVELGAPFQLWLWLLLLLPCPGAGPREGVRCAPDGAGPPLGLQVWPRSGALFRAPRSPVLPAPLSCCGRCGAGWAAGTAAPSGRVPLGVRRCCFCPGSWRVTHPQSSER